jgi:hypothetical protein
LSGTGESHLSGINDEKAAIAFEAVESARGLGGEIGSLAWTRKKSASDTTLGGCQSNCRPRAKSRSGHRRVSDDLAE